MYPAKIQFEIDKKSSSKIKFKNQFRELEISNIKCRRTWGLGVRKYRPLHLCHEHGVFRTLMIVILMIASRVMTIRTTIVQPYHQTISYIFSRSFWHKPTHCGPIMSNFDHELRSIFYLQNLTCLFKELQYQDLVRIKSATQT